MKAFVVMSIATPLDPANQNIIVRAEGASKQSVKAEEMANNLKNTYVNPQFILTPDGASVACTCSVGVFEVEIME